MATLFHQHQKNQNNNNNNNSGSGNNNNNNSGGPNTQQGSLNIKKLANGNTVLVGGSSSSSNTTADHPQMQNHAPGTTIILTGEQNGYSLPAKFVLPSTVAAGAGTILQQQAPQLIQLAPQHHHHHQIAASQPGTYQIVTSSGHQQQLLGKATTLTKVPTMMMATNGMNNHQQQQQQQQQKIISISNSGGGGGGGMGGPVIINGNGQQHQQQPHQLMTASGNILRIVPAGSLNNLVGTAAGGVGTGGGTQVIQVMGADGRIVTLTGIKKQAMTTAGTISGGRIVGGGGVELHQNNNNKATNIATLVQRPQQQQQQQQQLVTTGGGQMMSTGRPPQVVGGIAATTAGTIILDKAVTTTTTTANRISAVGGAAQNNNNTSLHNQHPHQSQQPMMVVPNQNHNNINNNQNNRSAFMNNDLQNNSAINGLKCLPTTSAIATSAAATPPPKTAADSPVGGQVVVAATGEGETTALTEAVVNPGVDATAEQQQQEVEGDEPEIDIVINNVVCSFSVRCHLNLREIALMGHNVEFRRENGMVTMKLRKPYTTASMWSSGKITCTGATSEEQAKIAARRYARCLQKLKFKTRLHNFRIVNVLGTCHMPWDIKITNFSERHRADASYEPELHPGVTYKLKSPKATLKIFSTGSVTVTAASVANVQEAIEFIFPLLYEFRKERPKVVEAPAQAGPDGLESSEDEDVYGTVDSDEDNVTTEGRLKEESFWSDEDENGKSVAGRQYLTGRNAVARKRPAQGKPSGGKVPKKVGRFAKNSKPHRRKRPLGKASNDPSEDVMEVSDMEEHDDF